MSDTSAQSYETHPLPTKKKGKLLGQKPPLKPKEVWSIRIRLQIGGKERDLALFNLAIDSKLRCGKPLVSYTPDSDTMAQSEEYRYKRKTVSRRV